MKQIEDHFDRLEKRVKAVWTKNVKKAGDDWGGVENKTPGPVVPHSAGMQTKKGSKDPTKPFDLPTLPGNDSTKAVSKSAANPALAKNPFHPNGSVETSEASASEEGELVNYAVYQEQEPEESRRVYASGAEAVTAKPTAPDRPYHDDILPKAWRQFIDADGGSHKGSLRKLEECVFKAVSPFVQRPVIGKYPTCQDLVLIRLAQPSGEVECHGLPLSDSFRNVMKFFEPEREDSSFEYIKEVVRTAEFDPKSMQEKGEWIQTDKGVVRL
jgi:hypothetical protein